ncbi:hypothetical protein [Methylobacterium iners]|uniref:Uncharacterized protein n=1 Tax=Methylobacterium iners TaxID=418707 RepID=A0ABQ4S1B1_9HYPH|nr:hypothetical protein [Methylobacterium iners]GJD96776.1 hypothetical protein OCOJLMKI_4001 [Methylobacterium iners]
MLVEATKLHADGYALVVYDPPAKGLPWLAVCLGPEGRLIAAAASSTAEAARSKVADLLVELDIKPLINDRPVH